jgi:hypothetical protein
MDPMWIVAPLVLLIPMLQSRRPVPHEASASRLAAQLGEHAGPPISGAERGGLLAL